MLKACVPPLLLLLLAAGARADTSPIPAADYTVARSWRLGGSMNWNSLALEASGARLFVGRSDHVDVVDTAAGRLTGAIAHTPGVRGIAFAPAYSRGFTSNSRSNSVSVFELDTLRVIQEVPITGASPEALLFEPQHGYIITANRDSSDLSVLDAGTLRGVSTVKLPGPPEFMLTDGMGHIYVNIDAAPGRLVVVDAKSLLVKNNWPLKDCANPTGMALDVNGRRVFSVCANQMMAVTDAVSGKAVARIVIGRGSDAAAYDSDLQMLFSSNGIDGTLTVVQQDSPDDYHVAATVTTQVSARSLVLDPDTHRLYLAAAQFGPPPASRGPDRPAARASVVPDTFTILVAQPR